MTIDEAEVELRKFLKKNVEIEDWDWDDVNLVDSSWGELRDADSIREDVERYLSEDNYYTYYDMARDIKKYDVSLEETFRWLSETGLDMKGVSFQMIAQSLLLRRAEDMCWVISSEEVENEINRLNALLEDDED